VERLGDRLIHEDIEPTTEVKVVELGGLRVVILICEDAARVEEFAGLLADLAATHVIVPVFSRPVHRRRWERAAADVYKRHGRTTMMVLNSKVMGTILKSSNAALEPRGMGLAIWPGGDVLFDVDEADDIQLLRLMSDGSVALVP
jgi:predicted amidohydrolase